MAAHDRIRLTGPLRERLRSPGPFLWWLRSRSEYANVCSRMIVCILMPRFELTVAAARRALTAPARIGAAPSRFAALAAASRARPRRAEIAPDHGRRLAAYLAPLPVSLLASRPEVAALPEALDRFGINTLGELAAL